MRGAHGAMASGGEVTRAEAEAALATMQSVLAVTVRRIIGAGYGTYGGQWIEFARCAHTGAWRRDWAEYVAEIVTAICSANMDDDIPF